MITTEDWMDTYNRMVEKVPAMSDIPEWATEHGWAEDSLESLLAHVGGHAGKQLGVSDPTASEEASAIAAVVIGAVAQALILGFELASAQRRTDEQMPDINNVLGSGDGAA